MTNFPIEVLNLTKKFKNFTAVNNISFSVKEGSIFGYLGCNGAGKTTTIRMLCGLIKPTSGNAMVAKYSVENSPQSIKKNIGYMSQKFSLYNDLKAIENLEFFASIYGLNKKEKEKKIAWALEMTNLKNQKKSMTSDLPIGIKQKLALCCAILHRPKVIFLDEPTSGVDPASRRQFWKLIQFLSDEGMTLLVTTHFLQEAEYCNQIALMHDGSIVAEGNPTELKQQFCPLPTYSITCQDILPILTKLKNSSQIEKASIFGQQIHLSLKESSSNQETLIHLLQSLSISYTHLQEIRASLEDVFIQAITKNNPL